MDLPLAVGIDADCLAGLQWDGFVVDRDRCRALDEDVHLLLLLVAVVVAFAAPSRLAVENGDPELFTAKRLTQEPEAAADRRYVLGVDLRIGHRLGVCRRPESTLRRRGSPPGSWVGTILMPEPLSLLVSEYVVGVDGCAGGWFAVWQTRDATDLHSACYQSIAAVVNAHADADRLLVDFPIGLPASEPRECDSVARQRLGARSSSVFPVPSRAVVEYAHEAGDDASYDRANELQREHLGSGLPKQAWNITPEIAEIDRLLRVESPAVDILESHPECCFAALNDWYPVAQPKATTAGRAARFGVLDTELDGWRDCYEAALDDNYRKHVARDDIVDALALVATGQHSLASLPAEPPTDAAGLPMQIVVPDIEPSWESFVALAER